MTSYALITGTTSGIGKALAAKFAREGVNLILVSRDEGKLKKQAERLSGRYGVKVHVVAVDLIKPDAAHIVYDRVRKMGVRVRYLVNNAGFNESGSFLETAADKEIDMIRLHAICTTQMMKLFIPDMVKSGHGRVLNLGSIASYMACPGEAVYAATKAYVLSVSKAIAAELKGTGVTITTLCPGATRTEFAKKAGMEHTLLFKTMVMKPQTVANIGYNALMAGKPYAIAGVYNQLLVLGSKFTPGPLLNAVLRVMLR